MVVAVPGTTATTTTTATNIGMFWYHCCQWYFPTKSLHNVATTTTIGMCSRPGRMTRFCQAEILEQGRRLILGRSHARVTESNTSVEYNGHLQCRFFTIFILTIFDNLNNVDDFWQFWPLSTILTISDNFWQFLTILTILTFVYNFDSFWQWRQFSQFRQLLLSFCQLKRQSWRLVIHCWVEPSLLLSSS